VRTLVPRSWGGTAAEMAAAYPCDGYLDVPYAKYVRAVDVEAPVATTFRWLCQLKVAPYSYDWIDNGGRTSPRGKTGGVEELAVGQPFLIFRIVDFAPGEHISGLIRPELRRRYGPIATTYLTTPRTPTRTRLVVRLDVGAGSPWAWLRRELLAAGDTVMMRKQLLTVKKLAERDA